MGFTRRPLACGRLSAGTPAADPPRFPRPPTLTDAFSRVAGRRGRSERAKQNEPLPGLNTARPDRSVQPTPSQLRRVENPLGRSGLRCIRAHCAHLTAAQPCTRSCSIPLAVPAARARCVAPCTSSGGEFHSPRSLTPPALPPVSASRRSRRARCASARSPSPACSTATRRTGGGWNA